jgi:hypothetical protein
VEALTLSNVELIQGSEQRCQLKQGRSKAEIQLKKKVKLSPVNATKAYRGNVGINPLILNLGTRWK